MDKLKKIADKLLKYTNETYVPVKTGKLLLSGEVTVYSKNEAEVTWGNDKVDYGLIVNERPSSRGFKFAEKAVYDIEDELIDMYEEMIYEDFLKEI